MESAASGLLAGRNAAALALGEAPASPPRTTAIGALAYYVSHAEAKHYQPSNITFGIMAPLDVAEGARPEGRRSQAGHLRAGARGARRVDGRTSGHSGTGCRRARGYHGLTWPSGGPEHRPDPVPTKRPRAPARCRTCVHRVPALQPQRVRPHRDGVRKRPRAVHHVDSDLSGPSAPGADAGRLVAGQRPTIPGRALSRRRLARQRRAQALRDPHLRTLAAT